MKIFFLLFLIIPLIEIYLLIEIGGQIGAVMTILLIVLTAVLGAFFIRTQGFSMITKAQMHLEKGEVPAVEMMEGVFLFIAGALLLTPGFFTDAIGFLCLTPPLRKAIIHFFIQSKKINVGAGHSINLGHGRRERSDTSTTREKGRILEGEFKDLDP